MLAAHSIVHTDRLVIVASLPRRPTYSFLHRIRVFLYIFRELALRQHRFNHLDIPDLD